MDKTETITGKKDGIKTDRTKTDRTKTDRTEKDRTAAMVRVLAVFTFFLSPLCAWGSLLFSKESAVFASLSRMIWYSGSSSGIFIAMLVMFIPMLSAFFLAHGISGLTETKKLICRICMLVSCTVLYLGAMWVMPSDGHTLTTENIWHGVLSFAGILMIFLTYCLYTFFIYRTDRKGAELLICFLGFTLITGAFAVINVFDERSYVIASAVSELYMLSMLNLIGFMTCYLACRKAGAEAEAEVDAARAYMRRLRR